MRPANFWTCCFVLSCLLAIGCQQNSDSKSASTSEEGGTALPSDGKGARKTIVPIKLAVKDIEGNWVVVITRNQSDSYRWILNFSRGGDGKIQGTLIDTSQDKDDSEKPQIVSTSVDGDSVAFRVKTAHGQFEFAGRFQQGFIRGTVRSGPGELLLTRLLPTDVKSLDQYSYTALPPGAKDFQELMKSKEFKLDDLLELLQKNRTTPVAQEMYLLIITNHLQTKFDETKLSDVINQFLDTSRLWGPRWEAWVEMSVGMNLVKGRQFSRLALAHLDAAEKLLGEDLPAYQKSIESYRDAAKINEMIQTIVTGAGTDEERATNFKELGERLKTHPFIPEILNALSLYAQQSGQVDVAIDYLSRIAALPLLEGMILQMRAGQPPSTGSPSENLKKLWVQKHGSDEGLIQHLDDVYHKMIDELTAEGLKQLPPVPAEKLGNKKVLVELFTGMQCPPCVSADLGLTATSKTYSTDHVIALRLHQHIPMPDGLANQDTEERANFYEVSSTPSIVIDGIPVDPRFYAGPIMAAPSAYAVLRRAIDSRITENTEVAIQLKADVADEQLTVSAEVTGVADEALPSCRLRLAIVENSVYAHIPMSVSSNGIREHEFVVREMLGGAKGIPPKKGELKYAVTIPLADIKQHVADYINRFEAGRHIEFPAGLKPPVRGPLSVVAWVQNGAVDKATNGKIVLQVAVAPIIGFGEPAAVTSTTAPGANNSAETAAAKPGPATDSPPPPALPE